MGQPFEIAFYVGMGAIIGSMVGGLWGVPDAGFLIGGGVTLVFELWNRFYTPRK